jgi:hypothetical protein
LGKPDQRPQQSKESPASIWPDTLAPSALNETTQYFIQIAQGNPANRTPRPKNHGLKAISERILQRFKLPSASAGRQVAVRVRQEIPAV